MRTKRCPRGTRRSRSSRIPEAFRIHQRPDFIGNRLQFGNWEGDLIIFDRDLGEANVMTLVERKSRYFVIIKNSSRHSKPIMNKIIQAFAALPYHARRSFTFDRGSEFMGYRALEDGMGARSWFCDPNSPWQKCTIENINKRIRRYLPSNTDLAQVSQAQLTALAHKLNATPRKCLGFKTPAEVFAKLLQEAA
ncbi:IS30 family transposase [Halomonas sp. FME20]|uniref:IS30 family transposase n=2 Tax=Pseudomonadota TaxID=1224 RepID=A0ABR9G337_9GAMM|nr:IS30 family transposase [Halomonas colorata]